MVTRNARVSDLAVAKVRRFCDQRVPAAARDEVCLEVTTWPPPSRSLSVGRCRGPRGPACRSPNFATTLPRVPGPCAGRTATDAGTATTTSTPPPPRRPPQRDRPGPSPCSGDNRRHAADAPTCGARTPPVAGIASRRLHRDASVEGRHADRACAGQGHRRLDEVDLDRAWPWGVLQLMTMVKQR